MQCKLSFVFKTQTSQISIPDPVLHRIYIHNKTGVFVKQECPRRQQSPKLAILRIKVTVKVTAPELPVPKLTVLS